MKTHQLTLLFPYWLLFTPAVFGQSPGDELIHGEFNNVSFQDFVREVEAQTGYFFYYDPAQSDSLKVNLQIKEQPLRKVLEQVFKDTELKYAMDNQKRVFITLGQEIITQLPAGLFEPDNAPAKEREVANYIPPNNEEEEKLLSTAENKLYEIGIKTYRIREGNATLTGYVRNALTGEPVIGAAVLYRKPSNRGCYRCAGSLFHLTSPWKASVAD